MTAQPRFHTPRDHSRKTLGGKLAALSEAMGQPLMPWQRMAADVALEIDPDTGRFHYRKVVITVPRQSGKSTMVLSLGLHRLLITPKARVWITAQTGQSARELFLEELAPKAMRILGGAIDLKRGAGATGMNFGDGYFRPHPPNDEYLHGKQSDLNLMDEVWTLTETAGDGLMQAIKPTQLTRPNAQIVMLSTMGDARSTWWHSRVDRAREGDDPRTCIVDWGLPEGEDPTNVEAVIAAHPAVGHTIGPDAIWDAWNELKDRPAEFARAYANVRTQTRTSVFDADVIARVVTEDATMTADTPLAFGVAVSWDRSTSVIVAAGWDAAGAPVAEVIDARPGTSWVAARLADLAEHHRPLAVMVDARSPASTIAADPALVEVITIPDSRTVAAGTAEFLDRVAAGTCRIRWDAEVPKAFDVLVLKIVGELGQMLDRKHSPGSIAHVEAVMLAMAGLMQAPAPAPDPIIEVY